MNEMIGLLVFALIGSGSPGPNNILLWAAGTQFGFRRCLPHILGTSLGLGTMAFAAGAGIGALLTSMPEIEFFMKILGSLYLLYLAFRIGGIQVVRRTELGRPLNLPQAIVFQYVNPKAWFFALTAVGTFRPASWSLPAGTAVVIAITMTVVPATGSIWALGGSALNRLIRQDRHRRTIGLVLALAMVGTVALIWI